jgi:hypothetical protein
MKTQETAIKDFQHTHGDAYDYSLVEYKNNNTKVKIICPTHGIFEQIPRAHTAGHGCKLCGVMAVTESNRTQTSKFIERASKKYPDTFTYDKTEYKHSKTPLIVTCRTHGDIQVEPRIFF